MNKHCYNENMNTMKAKIALSVILVIAIGLSKGYSQHQPTIDDKESIMKEIENLHEVTGWEKARKVEECSIFLGYTSYGAPWGASAMHGGILGASFKHVMVGLDFGFGSMIDETAYDNSGAFDYLKANSTQCFGLLSVHYYMIKYLSFGVGLGTHTELQKVESVQIDPHDGYSIETDRISFENKWLFCVRLGARAYIPVPSKVSIYLSGNYDIVPKGTRKSNFGLGVGLKINME